MVMEKIRNKDYTLKKKTIGVRKTPYRFGVRSVSRETVFL